MFSFRSNGRVFMLAAVAFVAALAIGAGAYAPARAHLQTAFHIQASPTSTPLLEEDNPSTGPGVLSQSAKGDGLVGQTLLKSTGTVNAASGVIGHDLSAKGKFNAGVRGDSTNGIGVVAFSKNGDGVVAQSVNADGIFSETLNPSGTTKFAAAGVAGYDLSSDGASLNDGLYGFSTNGTGVAAYSSSAAGYPAVYGNGASGPGVYGTSAKNDGVYASTTNPSLASGFGSSGVTGIDASTDGGAANFGIFGLSAHGTGLFGQGKTSLVLYAIGTPQDILDAYTSTGTLVARLDDGGNLHLSGKVFTSGSCSTGCMVTHTSSGRDVTAFSERSASPTIEDFGQAHLVNGQGYVRIDPTFAQAMDQRADYLVFLTPEGDSRGLYVTGKSGSGFTVRENEGGRSTLAFDYRIVAKPYDAAAQHLPSSRPQPLGAARPLHLAPQPRAAQQLQRDM